MYIPYEKFGNFINRFFKSDKLKSFFYDKKVSQNLRYIEKNKPLVLTKIRNKLKRGQKINVVFYCYDEMKWKCQSIYDIFNSDERFNVKILVTKSAAKNIDNPTYQSKEFIQKVYQYFKEKGLNVEYAYDIEKKCHIPFKKFNPDIIFYQHPWYVETSQGPVVCSKFALTCYVPDYFPIEVGNIDNKIDYYLRFHKYVERYYVLDKSIETKLKQKMDNGGKNVKIAGYPNLDYFYNNKTEGEYVIYAPHWTVGGLGLKYSAFNWSGKFMLEYAKNHSQIKWVFKPHPLLYKSLIDTKMMTDDEVKKYYDEWSKIGIKYEGGDYLEWFNKSKMMITDSCTFLGEYFVTEKPLIILMSESSPFKTLEHPILETYYCARNKTDLENLLETIPQNDYMRKNRLKTLDTLGLKNNNASENIFHDILNMIGGDYA